MDTLVTIGLLLWLANGFFGFLYWLTEEYDFTVRFLPVAIVASISGPLAWLIGWALHVNLSPPNSRVLIKKRGRE